MLLNSVTLTPNRSLNCYALMKPSFCHLFPRFSVTMEPHCSLKATKHLLKIKAIIVKTLMTDLGLNNSAYLVVKGGEGSFGAFAHGDDNLLVGDGGDIAGGIDAWDACAAMVVDDDLPNA